MGAVSSSARMYSRKSPVAAARLLADAVIGDAFATVLVETVLIVGVTVVPAPERQMICSSRG